MLDIINQYWFIVYLGGYLGCLVGLTIEEGFSPGLLAVALLWPAGIAFLQFLFKEEDPRERRETLSFITIFIFSIFVGCVSAYVYHELTLSPDERIARAEQQFQLEKEELEEAHRQEIKEAQTQVKLAEIEAKRLALYNDSASTRELEKAKAELARLRAEGADYSKLSQPKMSSASPSKPQEPGAPVDEQRRLVLSGLWLGACFFLQRVFEKLFKDKGYALLTVCAAGFLLAFFTANYFLLGGSVTGGLMGAAGDRT